jgi:hypothetical protein
MLGHKADPQHCSDQGKLAGDSCNRFGCILLDWSHYRSLPPLGTGSCCWQQEASQPVDQAGSNMPHKSPNVCSQRKQASKPRDDLQMIQ